MDKYLDSNRKRWNEYADHHIKTEFYDVEGFKRGDPKRGMRQLEVQEVGDVIGKLLLHLQCHFGMDTLAWERLGAVPTGVDFSERAIYHANELSTELSMQAQFVCSNIYDLTKTDLKPNSYDIVYTSHGTIYWLPDLKNWAKIISHFLKPGGIFYIMDGHPTSHIFDDENREDLSVKYSYFHSKEPLTFEEDGSYADPDLVLENKMEYGWTHDMSEIVNSLIEAGLEIEFVHEFPFLSWQMLPFMEKKDYWWYLPVDRPQLPLMFSIKARKK